ncbi:nitrogen regulator P-II GlnB [soil metagenome]
MKRITCYIKPHRVEMVKSAIATLGVSGLSVTDVRGTGNSPESTDWLGGDPSLIALPIRSKLIMFVSDEMVESVIASIVENTQTGESGDGKIFVEPVENAIRIRTNERGEIAI